MIWRLSLAASAVFTLLSVIFAIDCARMCAIGGSSMRMQCWLSAHTGIPCDTGLLIGLMICAMIGSAITGLLWTSHIARA